MRRIAFVWSIMASMSLLNLNVAKCLQFFLHHQKRSWFNLKHQRFYVKHQLLAIHILTDHLHTASAGWCYCCCHVGEWMLCIYKNKKKHAKCSEIEPSRLPVRGALSQTMQKGFMTRFYKPTGRIIFSAHSGLWNTSIPVGKKKSTYLRASGLSADDMVTEKPPTVLTNQLLELPAAH